MGTANTRDGRTFGEYTLARLLGKGGMGGFLASQKSGPANGPTSTLTYPTETTSPPLNPTAERRTHRRSRRRSADVVAGGSRGAAVQRLRQLVRSDRPLVSAELANHWVPQLSSKRLGVVDDGVVWDNAMILQEHLALREQYPGVRLLWSGDWSTFSAPDFWVTIVGITFSDSAGALAGCRSQDFDREHCVANIVSTTRPIEGSTAYNWSASAHWWGQRWTVVRSLLRTRPVSLSASRFRKVKPAPGAN